MDFANSTRWWILVTLTLLTSFLSKTQCKEIQHIRTSRSIKDALPKDEGVSQSRSILDMRHKVFNLETSVKNMNTEMDKISTQNNDLEVAVSQQRALLEKLFGEVNSLTSAISGHADKIGDLENLSTVDENLFALSNQTCGGVLVGQSGSIVFTSAALEGKRVPSTCIWTIRANNRNTIKIGLQPSFRSYMYSKPHAYVIEMLPRNDTNTSSTLQTKITSLQKNMQHIFTGPIVFVVYVLTSSQKDSNSEIDLQLHYEGMGKLVHKTTLFSHENLEQNSGNFSNSQIENWSNSSVATGQQSSENGTYSQDWTSIVISNFSTKVHLQTFFENGRCGDRDISFLVITDLLESNMAITDCCQKSCEGKNSLINYDNPFIIIVTKRFQVPLKFNILWESETVYPSSSSTNSTSTSSLRPSYSGYRRLGVEYGSTYAHKCGEVLGGISGSLIYKPHASYRNGERCIWTIVPQPRPRASITLTIGANGVETTYDHLYMMELVDVNGTKLQSGPKITRLGRYGTYEAHSRELYVVFYTDSSVNGYGFSLSWASSGAVVKTGKDVTTRFTILKGEDGLATSQLEKSPLTNSVYHVFLLTPIMPSSYVFGMQLTINQTQPVPTSGCLHDDISIYTAMDGILATPDMEELCSAESQPGQVNFEHAEGMAMIVVDDQSTDSNVAFNFSWREEYGKGNLSYVSVENNECGGVIKGDKGILKYKINEDYLNNERCIWLLQAPNHTSITLKLLKDGFESCCDNILVTTIDPTDGTLRNDTVIINRGNRTRTFEESVLILVFKSDSSTRGRGFALQFTGIGESEVDDPTYTYQLSHHNEPFGGVVFPSSDWEIVTPGSKNIFVIASSIKVGIDEDPFTTPTNISWSSGVFKKEIIAGESCSYESITFYTTPDSNGWLSRERYPNENETSTCADQIVVPKKMDICSTVYSAFVAVYRHLAGEAQEEEEEAEDEMTRMGFTFEKSAGCGGVFIGDSGKISYKEEGKYSNGERCVWLLHVPQAKKVRLRLERSGFEECCDVLGIYNINLTSAIPEQTAVISQSNKTALVDGPVAIIVFTTDSSVTGAGFRLTFSTEVNITEPFPYTFHLEHRNQPKQENYIFQVESKEIVIAAFSPELHRQSYNGIGRTGVSVKSFRPQIDEQCDSDTLTIFDVYGRERGLVASKSYTALNMLTGELRESYSSAVTTGNCSTLDITSNFGDCSSILDCSDTPENNEVAMNSSSFVAVYKSVNASGSLINRGLVMTSSTKFLTSLSSSTLSSS